MKAPVLWAACLWMGTAVYGFGAETDTGAEKTLSPYFFVENGDPAVDRVPLEATRVDVAVSGVIADVRVTQVYRNEGSRPINARYVFPASSRAAVHGMRMRIGDHQIVARIKEREQARAEFKQAVAAGKSASLLEQSRPNVFDMSVGNILPGDRIEVDLEYTELLVPEEGVYELVFPTVVGPRYSTRPAAGAPAADGFVASPYRKEGREALATFDIHVALATGVPLRDLASASHKVETEWDGAARASVRLAPDESSGGNRDFILRYRLSGEQVASGLLLHEGRDENFFLVMAQPPARVATADIPPREYIFVVDVSGSMNGFPLDVSKQLLRDLIGRLRPTDTFDVVLFSGDSQILSPRSVPATPSNIERAVAVIDHQRGGGGTELRAALEQALLIPRDPNVARSLVLVTDGFISAESDVFGLVSQNLGQANFFAFGIGSSVNRHLIEGVARAGRGEPFVITGPDEAGPTAERFRRYIESPVLTQVSVAFEGLETYDVEPATFPDLLAERPLVVFGKWRGARGGRIVVRGHGGQGPYEQVLDVSATEAAPAGRALPWLWARSRIASLSDYGVTSAAQLHRDDIVALGLRYNLLTAFTSFIAVYEVVRNTEGATDVDQPLPLPQGVSNLAVGGVMQSASEPGLVLMLAALAGLMLWSRRRRVESASAVGLE
jgi:Ca-activated chloride channel family protein